MLTLSAVAGCGGDDVIAEKPGILPPTAGPAKACTGADSVLAVSQIFIGDTDREGMPDAQNGWKEYGYDLDGRVSTKTSIGLCKPAAGGTTSTIYPDGNLGRDNSFGKNILPILLGLAPDVGEQANASIADGSFTLILKIEGVGSDEGCNPVMTKLYGGANLGMAPSFDGTDMWPVLRELLTDPTDIDTPKVHFDTSYLVGHTWVSGSKGTVTLTLNISDVTISLNIGSALISVDLDPDNQGGTNGTIAGVIATEELITQIGGVAATFDPSFCDPNSPTLQSILNQLRQASDIMKDGTQSESATCDGISIGIGFNLKPIQLGPIAPVAMPGPDPCAGTGGGGGSGTGGAGGTGG
jgi:hypothetical protein